MFTRPKPPAPTDAAVQAYETAVTALRLVDALDARPGTEPQSIAAAAAVTALRASLAAFLAVTCPGAEPTYYAAAATELYEQMFGESRGVAEALGAFLDGGFQYTDPFRAGHEPYTESTGGTPRRVRGACSCGFYGGDRDDLMDAQADAAEHAEWPIVQPVMVVPTGD